MPALSTPTAILLGAVVIALGLFFGLRADTYRPAADQPGAAPGGESLDAVREVSSDDHIRGNPDAPVVIIEYSDYECPFCKRFHETMNQVMAEYGARGEVAWVFRHFPLDQLHRQARQEAVAAECAAEQGGNDAFWRFSDRFFALTPSNDQTDLGMVFPQIVRELGLDAVAFESCLTSGRHDARIQADIDDALATGGGGTPWSIVIAPDGSKLPIPGALPYEQVKQIIDQALQQR